MKLILKKGNNFEISIDFLLKLIKETNKEVGELFFYKQEFKTGGGIFYHKLDNQDELLKTINPNIHDYIMITTKDFGPSFDSEFCYSVIGYGLNYRKKDSLIEKYENVEYFTSPEGIFYNLFIKEDTDNWRYNEKLIHLIEESLKNRQITQYFHPHKLKVVDIPDDVDWIIQSDEDGDGEYVRENIEVRTWY